MKQLTILKRLVPLVCLLLPVLSLAATQEDNSQIFDLALTDPSRIFLGQLFGSVGSALHGTGSDVFGVLFRYFNIGILGVSSLFTLWTTVKLIISSSTEGSFMGRGGQGAYHVMRTVAGIGLLVPGVSGYSAIQVLVMYFVVQGAGFANSVWDKLLTSFERGSQLMVPPSKDLETITDLTGSILMAQVCMYYHERMEAATQTDAKKIAQGRSSDPRAGYFPGYHPTFDIKNNTVSFPAKRGNDPADAGCGQINWTQTKAQNNDYVESAIRAVVSDTASIARNIANPRSSDLTIVDKEKNITAIDRQTQTVLVGANSDWSNILLPVRAKDNGEKLSAEFYKRARRDGWLYAGSYYYELAKVQRDLMDAMDIKVQFTKPIACIFSTEKGEHIKFPLKVEVNECVKDFNKLYANSQSTAQLSTIYNNTSNYVVNAKALARQVQEANSDSMIPKIENNTSGIAAALLSPITSAIGSTMGYFAQNGGDPIMKLQSMGTTMMAVIGVVWLLGSIGVFALSATASIMSSTNSFGYAVSNTVAYLTPLLMALLAVIFVQGAIIAVYVPLIPFIVFTFAILGWFIAVIEAMIAAPLVALGITHPEGQGLLGKSEQAMMLLLGVFLRPVLMIMGLFGGMLLSRIMLTIFNVAFMKAVSSTLSIWGFIATFTIYIVLVMQVITQSYSLIYLVPDRIMRWLGSSGDQSMAGEALRAAENQQRTISESGARIGSGTSDGMKATGDRISSAKDSPNWGNSKYMQNKSKKPKLSGTTT